MKKKEKKPIEKDKKIIYEGLINELDEPSSKSSRGYFKRKKKEKKTIDKEKKRLEREQKIIYEGLINESLSNGMFRVRLDNDDVILGSISGKIRCGFIRIMPGDRVKVEVSRYDKKKGRILYRLPKTSIDKDSIDKDSIDKDSIDKDSAD